MKSFDFCKIISLQGGMMHEKKYNMIIVAHWYMMLRKYKVLHFERFHCN